MNTDSIVQVKNPKGMYVKIDRDKGQILGYKKTPWKNVPMGVKKECCSELPNN